MKIIEKITKDELQEVKDSIKINQSCGMTSRKDYLLKKLYDSYIEEKSMEEYYVKDVIGVIKKYCERGIDYYKKMDKGKAPRQYDDDFVQERVRFEEECIFNDILEIIDPFRRIGSGK